MRLDFAKYTPLDKFDNIKNEERGAHNVFVLTNGKNEPKEMRNISSKLSRVLVESYLERPSLKNEAFEKIIEMANNAVIAAQTPNFRIECEYLMLVLFKNRVKWVRNGEVTLLKFEDGKLVSRTEKSSCPALGTELSVSADLYETETLEKKDYYFVAFTGDLEEKISMQAIEKHVGSAESASELQSLLLRQYASNGGEQNISLFSLHLPPKKKPMWLLLAIPLIALFVFFVIGALGRMRYGM